MSTEKKDWTGEPFVPKSDFDGLVKVKAELDERIIFLTNEVNQLRDALKQVNQGIHKASEENIIGIETFHIKVESWRHCRNIAMDLLHIPIGGEELQLIIKLENGYLRGIKQK